MIHNSRRLKYVSTDFTDGDDLEDAIAEEQVQKAYRRQIGRELKTAISRRSTYNSFISKGLKHTPAYFETYGK